MENIRSIQDFHERGELQFPRFYEAQRLPRRDLPGSQHFPRSLSLSLLSPLSSSPSYSPPPSSPFSFSASQQNPGKMADLISQSRALSEKMSRRMHRYSKHDIQDQIFDSERRSYGQLYMAANGGRNSAYRPLSARQKNWHTETGFFNEESSDQCSLQRQFYPPYLRGPRRELYGPSEMNFFTLASPDSSTLMDARYYFRQNMLSLASLRAQSTAFSPQSPSMPLSMDTRRVSKKVPSSVFSNSSYASASPPFGTTPSSRLSLMIPKTRDDVWNTASHAASPDVSPATSSRIQRDNLEDHVKAYRDAEFKTLVELLFKIKLYNSVIVRDKDRARRLLSRSASGEVQYEPRGKLNKVRNKGRKEKTSQKEEGTRDTVEMNAEEELEKNGQDFSNASYEISLKLKHSQYSYLNDHTTLRAEEIDLDVNKIITCEEAEGIAEKCFEQIMGERLRRSKRKRKIKEPYQYDQSLFQQKQKSKIEDDSETPETHSNPKFRSIDREENFVVDDFYSRKDAPKKTRAKNKPKAQKPKRLFSSMRELNSNEKVNGINKTQRKKIRKDQINTAIKNKRNITKRSRKSVKNSKIENMANEEALLKKSVNSRKIKNLKLKTPKSRSYVKQRKIENIDKSEKPEKREKTETNGKTEKTGKWEKPEKREKSAKYGNSKILENGIYFGKNGRRRENVKNGKNKKAEKIGKRKNFGKTENVESKTKETAKHAKMSKNAEKKVPLQIARGLEKNKRVLIRRIEYRSGNICAKMEPYVGTIGVIVTTPIYPGTWYSVRMFDGVIVKCRSTSFTRNLGMNGKTEDEEKTSFGLGPRENVEEREGKNWKAIENESVGIRLDKCGKDEAQAIQWEFEKSAEVVVGKDGNSEKFKQRDVGSNSKVYVRDGAKISGDFAESKNDWEGEKSSALDL